MKWKNKIHIPNHQAAYDFFYRVTFRAINDRIIQVQNQVELAGPLASMGIGGGFPRHVTDYGG